MTQLQDGNEDVSIEVGKNDSVKAWDLVEHYLQPIAKYFEEPGVTEICIDGPNKVYIERFGKFEDSDVKFKGNREVEKIIRQIANALNQEVDPLKFPAIDARLPSGNGRPGARINGVLAPVSTLGACLTIRVFPPITLTAADLLERKTFTEDMLDFLKLAILSKANLIVSGSTGSGKTTLINVLGSLIQQGERVITIEDTAELQINTQRLVSVEAPRRRRKLNEDFLLVDMPFLLRNALRQRPDRIIVGEIRSAEAAIAFLQAINTGHEGCMTTLHANSCQDALLRMEILAASEGSNLPYNIIQSQVRNNIHLLVHQKRVAGQGIKTVEISEVSESKINPLWKWDYKNKQHVVCADYKRSKIYELAMEHSLI